MGHVCFPENISLRMSQNGEGNGNPLQYSCLGNPMDRGGWRATVHGVEKNRKWLSMHVCMQGERATQKTHLAEGFQGRGFKGNIWGKGCSS